MRIIDAVPIDTQAEIDRVLSPSMPSADLPQVQHASMCPCDKCRIVQAVPGADGDSRPLHQTEYERELDALTRQFERTACLYHVHKQVDLSRILPNSHLTFRLFAGALVALADSGKLTYLKAATVKQCADDQHEIRDVRGYSRKVIETFLDELFAAGEAVSR